VKVWTVTVLVTKMVIAFEIAILLSCSWFQEGSIQDRTTMNEIIVTSPDTLRAIVSEAVSQAINGLQIQSAQQSEAEERLMTERELRERLGVSHATIYRLKTKGLLPFKQIGRSIRYYLSDVVRVMEGFQELPTTQKKHTK